MAALAALTAPIMAPVKLAPCHPSACSGLLGLGASSCPGAASFESKPLFPMGTKNLWFRNAARWPAEILSVTAEGEEVSQGFVAPDTRLPFEALHGEVWRARAVRPGHPGDRRLMLEEKVGVVPLRECECPQPAFVDCQKPPYMGPRWTPDDPVVFRNDHPTPVDLFWFNGTCEEIVSWNEIGGLMPQRMKRFKSTQGHTFRVRSAADGHMLMQHTLDDLVLRGCDDEEKLREREQLDALRIRTASLEQERDQLRDSLAARLNKLILALQAAPANSTSVAVGAGGETALEASAKSSMLNAGLLALPKAR